MKSRKFQYGLFGKVTAALLVLLLCAPLFSAKKETPAKAGDDEAAYREGMEIFYKVVKAGGGMEAFKGVKNYTMSMSCIRVTDTELVRMDALAVLQYPDKLLYKLWPKRGVVIMSVDGDSGWQMVTPRPMAKMGAGAIEGQLGTVIQSMPYMIRHLDQFKVKFLGEVDFYGKKALKLQVTGLSGRVDYSSYVDPETYLSLGSSYYSSTATSEKPQLIEGLSYDHKKIDGIVIPTRVVLKSDGRITMGYKVTAYKTNIDLTKDYFTPELQGAVDLKAKLGPGSLEKGKAIFDKVAAALGGEKKIREVKNILVKMVIDRITPTQTFTMNAASLLEYPDKLFYTIRSRRGQVVMAVDGDKGWQQLPPRPREAMPEKDRQAEMSMVLRDSFFVIRNRDKYEIRFAGETEFAGKKALDLYITGLTEFHLYVDPANYMPLGTSFVKPTAITIGDTYQEEIYSDYRKVDGIFNAFKLVLRMEGRVVMVGKTKEIRYNVKTGKDFFNKLESVKELGFDQD